MDEDDDDENWADRHLASGGRSRPSNGNDNDDGEGEDDTERGEKATGKENGTKDGMGNGKGKGKGSGKGKGKDIVEQTPGGNAMSRGVAFQLQREMYQADCGMEG